MLLVFTFVSDLTEFCNERRRLAEKSSVEVLAAFRNMINSFPNSVKLPADGG